MLDCGRRFGKTTLGLDRSATPDVLPYPVGWFSPTYKMLTEVWREAVRTFGPITARRNASDHRLEFITGGVFECWSLDNPDAARGRKYRRIIVDEAAMVPALMDAWQYVLRPTLVDMGGDAWFLSTPKGRNGFWQMFQWGRDPEQSEWAAWQMTSYDNPKLDPVELDALRATMTERAFTQEILAQFLEDGGGVFRRVLDAATATVQDKAQPRHQYVFGVDWGRSADFSVITVVDLATREVVCVDRFNQIDYVIQLGRLQALCDRFAPSVVLAEANSMGQPLIDHMRRTSIPVQPFVTTNATKSAAIDALALAFEQGAIRIPNDAALIAELQAYEMERLPSGLLRYNAPEGMHDDCVMSLALAWQAAEQPAARDLIAFG